MSHFGFQKDCAAEEIDKIIKQIEEYKNSHFGFQKDCTVKEIDKIIKQIEEYKDSHLAEVHLEFFNEILLSRITETINTKKIKKSKLDNAIFDRFNQYLKDGENENHITEYIVNNYEFSTYDNKTFVFGKKMKFGNHIKSIKFINFGYGDGIQSVLNGPEIFVNDNTSDNFPYPIAAFNRYKNGKNVKSEYSTDDYCSETTYLFEDMSLYNLSENEKYHNLLKDINKDILKDNAYPHLNKIINEHNGSFLAIVDEDDNVTFRF